MSNAIWKIGCGQIYVTSDGEQFTVTELDLEGRYAVIETLEGDAGVIALREMLDAVRTGEIVFVDELDQEADDSEKTD